MGGESTAAADDAAAAAPPPPEFREPPWAVTPGPERARYSLHAAGGGDGEVHELNARSSYVLGRDASRCAVVLRGPGVSREHAALVHHENGSMYVIHLSAGGVSTMDGAPLARHKTARLKHGQTLAFGGAPDGGGGAVFRVVVDGALKRKARDEPAGAAAGGPTEVRCSHILVKHRDSRRPSSWKEKVITRSREDAVAELEVHLRRLHEARAAGGTDAMVALFGEIASAESHCSSARRGGDLGAFGRGKMQRPFEEASFALGVNELTERAVVSDSGVHLILRTG